MEVYTRSSRPHDAASAPTLPVEVHGDSSATAIWTDDELREMADSLSIEGRQREAEAKFIDHLKVNLENDQTFLDASL